MKTSTASIAAFLPVALVHAQVSTQVGTPSSTGSSSGSVQTVQVGQGGLRFEPNSITANQGDVIEFVIHRTHNVARSSFDSPCQPISGAQSIWSGNNLADGTVFSVTVNNTDPVWLYCATGQHCQDGMGMVINPGSDTIDTYLSNAKNVMNTGTPTEIAGGVYGSASGGSGASSSSASSSGSASTSASASASSSSSMSTSRPAGSSTMTSGAPTSTTTNAAATMMADLMMVGGAVLGGAVLLM